MRRRLFTISAVSLMLCGSLCGCQGLTSAWNGRWSEDVTADSQYRPHEIVGRCFVFMRGGFINKAEAGSIHGWFGRPDGWEFPTYEEYKSGQIEKGTRPMAFLISDAIEPGTRVKIVALIRETTVENQTVWPLAEIMDGRLKGKRLYVDEFELTTAGKWEVMSHWSTKSDDPTMAVKPFLESNRFVAPCTVPTTEPHPSG